MLNLLPKKRPLNLLKITNTGNKQIKTETLMTQMNSYYLFICVINVSVSIIQPAMFKTVDPTTATLPIYPGL